MKFALVRGEKLIRQAGLGGLLFFIFLPFLVLGQQDNNTRQFTLSQINFEGLKTIAADKAIAASGLQKGQTATLQQLKEAAQRLLGSGLFRQVKFQYKYLGNNLAATFVVEEHQASMPCHFDNFAWF